MCIYSYSSSVSRLHNRNRLWAHRSNSQSCWCHHCLPYPTLYDDGEMYAFPPSPSILAVGNYLTSSILTSYVMQDERYRRISEDYCEPVLRHEHIHFFPLPQGQGARQRTLKPV
jgi:hypothetical protein